MGLCKDCLWCEPDRSWGLRHPYYLAHADCTRPNDLKPDPVTGAMRYVDPVSCSLQRSRSFKEGTGMFCGQQHCGTEGRFFEPRAYVALTGWREWAAALANAFRRKP